MNTPLHGSGLPDGAVLYGVVPPLFGNPPLRSVTGRLDDLKELGVDAIWLSPLCATADPSQISYSVTDYLAMREDFGTKGDLRELVTEAHKRGIKVLLDFVPNHTSVDHPFYQDAEAKGESSPYYNYYERKENGESVYLFDWKGMRNLNYENPEVCKMMAEAFSHWIKEFDIDGFRVDAAWGIRKRSPEFFPRLIADLRAIKPDLILIAEAPAWDPYYATAGFDLAYDWGKKLGRWAWVGVFEDPANSGAKLSEIFGNKRMVAGSSLRFINNNDTGRRFIEKYGEPMTRLAAVLEFTLPGAALLYTGDEIGAKFLPYEDSSPLAWETPTELRPFYTQLGKLRQSLPALRSGSFIPLKCVNSTATFAFLREAKDGEAALVVINFGENEQVLTVQLPQGVSPDRLAGSLKDELNGGRVAVSGGGQQEIDMNVKGTSAYVLSARKKTGP